MISRASLIVNFGKNFVKVSSKNIQVSSVSLLSKFSEQKKKEPLGSYLTDAEIRQKVQEKQLSQLLQHVKSLQEQELSRHKISLAKAEKQLNGEQKSRVQRINELINGLNEAEAEYLRYRLFKAVDA